MSAREVGGDLYAYYTSIPLFSRGAEWSSERKYIVAVGDVTSKGMPAALLMAVSLASLGSTVRQGLPPRQLLAQLDITLVDYTRESRQNCALVYAEIIPPALEAPPQETAYLVRMANAGCPAPLIKRHDGSVAWVDVGGLPLGLGLGAETGYSEVELSLAKGEFLILISDGIIEARNAEGELYGFERLEAAVAAGPMASAEAMLQHLKIEVEAFVGSTEPHDDLTMVVVQV
jgi:serine phosphatase RsbU (regulator of sigma subunit)